MELPRGLMDQGNMARKLRVSMKPFVAYEKHNKKRQASASKQPLLFSPLCSDRVSGDMEVMGKVFGDIAPACLEGARRQRLLSACFGAGLGWTVA